MHGALRAPERSQTGRELERGVAPRGEGGCGASLLRKSVRVVRTARAGHRTDTEMHQCLRTLHLSPTRAGPRTWGAEEEQGGGHSQLRSGKACSLQGWP